MDKLTFTAPDTGEEIEFYILEQTTITGCNYILVTEEEEGDGECYILKETGASDGDDATYEFDNYKNYLRYQDGSWQSFFPTG